MFSDKSSSTIVTDAETADGEREFQAPRCTEQGGDCRPRKVRGSSNPERTPVIGCANIGWTA
jgi:hypothetical protein